MAERLMKKAATVFSLNYEEIQKKLPGIGRGIKKLAIYDKKNDSKSLKCSTLEGISK